MNGSFRPDAAGYLERSRMAAELCEAAARRFSVIMTATEPKSPLAIIRRTEGNWIAYSVNSGVT